MEKLKLYSKITFCMLLIIASAIAGFGAWTFGDVEWLSVAVLVTTWWLSFLLLALVIIDCRDILAFVKRTVQHHRSLPKGVSSNRLLGLLLVTLMLSAAIYFGGHLYLAALNYGEDVDAIMAGAITVFSVCLAKTYGYHRYDTKRVKKDSVEYVSLGEMLV